MGIVDRVSDSSLCSKIDDYVKLIFLKNPEIIILDEPTSALDSFSEEDITEAMNNLFA